MNGFYIAGRDAKFDLFDDAPNDCFCPKCGCLLDPSYLPPRIGRNLKIRFDMFSSAEGVEFVSDHLRRFLEYVPGVEIVEIESENGTLNALRSTQLVTFDVKRRPVAFDNHCDLCGQFKDIYRALPVYLVPGQLVEPHSLYMTDLYSGHGRLKRRKLIAGASLAAEMQAAGFTGISFDPVAS